MPPIRVRENGRNGMSVRYVSLERIHGLKALRRSPAPEGSAPGMQRSWLNGASDLPFRPKTIRYDPARLFEALGASPKTNQYGDHLSVRCWCAQPPRYSPDLRALRLLMPNAPDEIADPGQWLFLDTETTGLAGGSSTYAFLVGIAWWEGGGLEIEPDGRSERRPNVGKGWVTGRRPVSADGRPVGSGGAA